jgi:hypothetical protein
MGRGNTNPKHKYISPYEEPMAAQIVGVRLPLALDAYVRSLPNKSEWLRKAIADAYERDQQQRQQQESCT